MFIRSCLDLQSLWSHIFISHILLGVWCEPHIRQGGMLGPHAEIIWCWKHPLLLRDFHLAQTQVDVEQRTWASWWWQGFGFEQVWKKKSPWFLILWDLDLKRKPQHGEGKVEVLHPYNKIRSHSVLSWLWNTPTLPTWAFDMDKLVYTLDVLLVLCI